jgi:hypothetical protein
MLVNVTQFIRPDGHQRIEYTTVPNDCAVGYKAMQRKNCRITAEAIYGNVALSIEHEEGDFDIQIVPNGPQVQETLANMLRSFDSMKFDTWLKDTQNA